MSKIIVVAGSNKVDNFRGVLDQIRCKISSFENPHFVNSVGDITFSAQDNNNTILGMESGDCLVFDSVKSAGETLREVLKVIFWGTKKKVSIYILELGPFDLTAEEGRQTRTVLAVVEEFHRS